MGLCPTMAPSTPFFQRPSFACRINQLPARKNWPCYVQEFATRHNIRNADTIDQMRLIVEAMANKRLRYRDLIADNGLDSGARPTL